MLYVYFGTDAVTARENARIRARVLAGEGSEHAHISSDGYYPGVFAERAEGVSLFGTDTVTILDSLSDDAAAYDALVDALPMLAESTHSFVVVEGGLLAAEKKQFQKYATECTECAAEKKERFNTFALTDALVARDKKTLWLRLLDAVHAGISWEEIIGVLFWQIKVLRLVARTQGAEEAGLKPFVYSKAKRALVKFTPDEIDRFSRELIAIYHDGHRGKRDIGLALERWVLML